MQAGQVILHAYQTPSATYFGNINPVRRTRGFEPSKLALPMLSSPQSVQYIFSPAASTAMPVGLVTPVLTMFRRSEPSKLTDPI